ncbi:DUF397 domain-containing protein [Streptomyces longispororuber]|uniref:DUF397 domain-containing protein n=1 Tax=Streptomyces longispororuber TaxID=68230 RepID=UPI00210A1AA7|nr:DUF397 domain-containing protein [Streptomyces longispororuber]MCQ4209056.1 DUF397 domain-containing protein [Streptomyces longispororuber]
MNSTGALSWFKSSYSGSSGDDCVEVALAWRKSSHSSGSSGDCVEVAACPTTVHVRDSKRPADGQLALSSGAWADFVRFTGR